MVRGCPSQDKGGGLKIRWRRPAWVQIPPPAPNSIDLNKLFNYDSELIKCLSRIYGDRLRDFLTSILYPPKRYYIRVNVLKISPGELIDILRSKGFDVYRDEYIDEALYFKIQGPFNIPLVDKVVVVDKYTAESVYLGANVYAPGVVGISEGVRKGDEVNIVSRNGILVGYGVVVEEPEKLKVSRKGLFVETVISRYNAPKLHEMEEYKLGYFYEQSYPSILTSKILNPQPGDVVVDMCAAPGGKTGHIVELTKGKAKIIAFDHSGRKVEKLRENLRRLGHEKYVDVYRADSRYLHIDYPWIKADKTVLDPPCSALGVIPKLYDEKSYRDVVNYMNYQIQFLKTAYHILKPKGLLIYSTCTVTIEENESVIGYAQKIGFKVIDIVSPIGSKGIGGYDFIGKVLRFHPHIHGTTGYFIALLMKV